MLNASKILNARLPHLSKVLERLAEHSSAVQSTPGVPAGTRALMPEDEVRLRAHLFDADLSVALQNAFDGERLEKVIDNLTLVAALLDQLRVKEASDGDRFALHPRFSEYVAYAIAEKLPPLPQVPQAIFMLVAMPYHQDAAQLGPDSSELTKIFRERDADALWARMVAAFTEFDPIQFDSYGLEDELRGNVLSTLQRLMFHATVVSFRQYARLRPQDGVEINEGIVAFCKHEAAQLLIGDPLVLAPKASALGASNDVQDLAIAASYAEAAIEFYPEQPGYLHTLARILLDLKTDETRSYENLIDLGRAYETVSKAIMLDPEYPRYYLTRGRIASELDLFAQAASDFDMAHFVAKMPGNEDGLERTFADEVKAARDRLRTQQDSANILAEVATMRARLDADSAEYRSEFERNRESLKRQQETAHLQTVNFQASLEKWKSDVSEMKRQVRSTEMTSFTLLGLIATILAVIVGGSQTVKAVVEGGSLRGPLLALLVVVVGLALFLSFFFIWLRRRDREAMKTLSIE